MLRFQLERDTDLSGVSGLGIVAEGVQFTDGRCALRWLSDKASTALYDNTEDLLAIHGHNGATRLVWLDELPHHDRPGVAVQVEFDGEQSDSLSRRAGIIAKLRRAYP